jgi:DNA-binding response OmpR family regulator
MRRTEAFATGDTQSKLSVGDFVLDPLENKATVSGKVIDLTPIEFRLLYCLARNSGRILSHEFLLTAVWGYEYEGYSNQVAVYVRRLRNKIEKDPANPEYLLTVRGLGYRFEA